MKDMEKSFSDFMDSESAEKVFSTFFSAVREAYIAGYKAASEGEQKNQERVINIYEFDKLIKKDIR